MAKPVEIIIDAVDKASDVAGNIAGSFGKLGNTVSTAFGFALGGVISGGLSAIADSVGAIKDGMINGNAEFERYTVQFGVLLGSTDAAKKRLEDLAKFGASTPFELPEVVQADKVLQGFGLHSEEAAKKFGFSGEEIRTIAGDVASGTGVSFQDMATYIGKFSSGATGEVISRFQEMGITTREELTKLGLEFSKSGQLLSPLPEATQVVLNLMKKKYGGMMDAQSKTFEGMMSNLQDWVGGTLRTLGQPIFEVLKSKLETLLQFLGSPQVQEGIKGFANFMAGVIGKGVELVTPILNGLMDTIMKLPTIFLTLKSGSPVLIASALGISPELVNTVMGIINQVTGVLGQVVAWVQSNWPAIQATINNVIQQVVAFIVSPFMPAVNGIIAVFNDVVAWIQTNWPAISAVINQVIQAIVATINDPLIPNFNFVLSVVQKIVLWFQENWPLIQQTFNTVINALMPVVKTVLPALKAIFDDVFNGIKVVVSSVVDAVLGIVKAGMQLLNGDTEGALNTLKGTFSRIWENILQYLRDIVPKMLTIGSNIIAGIRQGMEAAGESLKNFLIGLVKSALGKLADFLDMHSPSMRMHYFGKMMVMGMAQGIQSNEAMAIKAAKDLAEGVSNQVQSAVESTVAAVQGLTGTGSASTGLQGLGAASAGRGLGLDGRELSHPEPVYGNDDAHDRAAFAEASNRANAIAVQSPRRRQPPIEVHLDGQQLTARIYPRLSAVTRPGMMRSYAQ